MSPSSLDVRLAQVKERYLAISAQMEDPTLGFDPARFETLSREQSQLRPVVELLGEVERAQDAAADALSMAAGEGNQEMRSYLESEARREHASETALMEQLKLLLLPRDPDEDRDAVVEIRAGTGGDEAALFAADLLRMYLRFAERRRWQVELLDSSPTEGGGFKEVVLEVHGRGAYGQ
ncbi:MAG: PCRF domain-containing protein, partial [Candidatus Dormibacteria bacterium]